MRNSERSMSSTATENAEGLFNITAYTKMGVFAKPATEGENVQVIEPQGDVLEIGQRWFAFQSPWGGDSGHDVLKLMEGDYMAYKPNTGKPDRPPECYRAERSSFEDPNFALFEELKHSEKELEEEIEKRLAEYASQEEIQDPLTNPSAGSGSGRGYCGVLTGGLLG